MLKEDTIYNDLMTFFSSFSSWEENEYLYSQVNTFLIQYFSATPIVVLSIHKESYFREKHFRTTWNKEILELEGYERFLISIDKKTSEVLKKGELYKEEQKKENYRVFSLGEDDAQIYFICFKYLIDSENEFQNNEDLILNALIPFCRNSFAQTLRWKNLNRQNSLIHIDDVTGLFNQRKLYKDLESLILRYDRSGDRFSLLFIDIDHFKNVNDHYGHLVGTKVLAELGKVLKKVLRDTDFLYRYGGDEFVAIITDAGTNDARKIGERILNSVKNETFLSSDGFQDFHLSISIGIAAFPQDAKDGKEILELADRMMYRAKNRGRGQVCLAGDFYK